MDRDDDAWAALEHGLGATLDASRWLHVTILGRPFALTRAALGTSRVVVAHSAIAHAGLDAEDIATIAGRWPVGGVVMRDGCWVSRHTFAGVPAARVVRDVLQALVLQIRDIEALACGSSPHSATALAHYAD
jgi:hypothetical protein